MSAILSSYLTEFSAFEFLKPRICCVEKAPHPNNRDPALKNIALLHGFQPVEKSYVTSLNGSAYLFDLQFRSSSMHTLDTPFGWMFTAITALFALGLTARFAPHFYPKSPGFVVRLAAPTIFALLAAACFHSLALPTLAAVTALGLIQITVAWRGKRTAKTQKQA